MIEDPIATWKTIDARNFKPDYINASGFAHRSYSNAVELQDTPERFAVVPTSIQLTFIKYFVILFLPFLLAILYWFIDGPEKWSLMLAGITCGLSGFLIIYFMLSREINAGPYLEIESNEDTVRLVRYKTEMKIKDLDCLQYITGGSSDPSQEVNTDLNLIARNADGSRIRYFLFGAPSKPMTETISSRLSVPIEVIDVGTRGKRDIDASLSKDLV